MATPQSSENSNKIHDQNSKSKVLDDGVKRVCSLSNKTVEESERNTQEISFADSLGEIKEEILPNYSVDGWCELGPSTHAFGDDPDKDCDIDLKDEIKKSPRVENEDLNYSDDSDKMHSNQTRSLHTTPNGTAMCFNGDKTNGKIINGLRDSTSNKMHLELKNKAKYPVPPVESRHNGFDERMSKIKNVDEDRPSHLIEETGRVSKLEEAMEVVTNEHSNPSMTLKVMNANIMKFSAEPSQQNLNTSFNPNERYTKGITERCSSTTVAKDLTRTLQPGSQMLHPIPATSHNVSKSFNTEPFRQHQQEMTHQNRDTNDLLSIPRLSNSFKSPTEFSAPFFAKNFTDFTKDDNNRISESAKMSNGAQYCLPTLVTGPQQYFNTSLEDSRFYQTWVKPNQAGYFHCQPIINTRNSNNNNNNNNKMMFLTPQTIILQQLPYISLFQQSSFNSLVTSAASHPIAETQNVSETALGNTSLIFTDNPPIPVVSTSSKDTSNGAEETYVKSADKTWSESEILNLDSVCQRNENDNCKEVNNPGKQFGDRTLAHTTKNQPKGSMKLPRNNSGRQSKGKQVDDIIVESHTVIGETDGKYRKGCTQEMVMPKMSRGKDFVDPTRIKLDQDDELGDSNIVYNEDNSSDEDWLPEKRDGDKSLDSENDDDLDIDEGYEEKEVKLNGNKQKSQRKFSKEKSKKQHKETSNKTLICHYCRKVFQGSYHLKRHLLSHTENRPHQCNTCGKRFKQKAHLHGHEIVHIREKSKTQKDKSNCNVFNNKTNTTSPYKCPGRPKKVYSEKELSCNVCNKVFKTLYRLKRHVQSHTDVRPYTCKVCGKGFKQTGHRNEHEANHEKNRRKFLCNICGVIFHCRSSFNNHLKTHRSNQVVGDKGRVVNMNNVVSGETGDRNVEGGEVQHTGYDCPYCTDKFATAQGLNRHLDSHVEVRQRLHVQPYSCHICSRSFTYKHNLAKHMLTHQAPEKFAEFHKSKLKEHLASGRPSYTCPVCSKVFMRKETLAKHSKVHTGTKPFKCEVCLKEFTQNVHLKVHTRKHTGSRPFQCKRCNQGFIDSTALAKHIEYEACISENMLFHCTICDKRHYYLGSIKQHIKKEHNESDVNKFISRTVRQRRPRASNASAENTCKICSKPFSEKVNLIRHVKRKHSDLLKLLDNDLNRRASGNEASHSHDERDSRLSSKIAILEGECYNQLVANVRLDAKALSTAQNDILNIEKFKNNESGSNDHVFANTIDIQSSIQEIKTKASSKVEPGRIEIADGTNAVVLDDLSRGTSRNDRSTSLKPVPNVSCAKAQEEKYISEQGTILEKRDTKSQRVEAECINKEEHKPDKSAEIVERGVFDRKENDIDSMRDEERNERITEPNVNKFLYHVGLVEKSKAAGIERSRDSNICSGDSFSSTAPSYISEPLRDSSDISSVLYSGHQVSNRDTGAVGIQDDATVPRDVFRSNLEVFCDLALMTENRLGYSKIDSTSISRSTYLNEFQDTVNSYHNEATSRNQDSSVTETQLKELGLVVCKDAEFVRNKRRPSEDLYAEFKPWLEQLVRPSAVQSLMLYATKTNPSTLKVQPTNVETQITSKSSSKEYYQNQQPTLASAGSSSASHHQSCISKDSAPCNTSLYRSSSTATSNQNSTGRYSLNQVIVTSAPVSWTSSTPPLYGVSNVHIQPNNYVHSIRLREQLLHYVQDKSKDLNTTGNIIRQSTNSPLVSNNSLGEREISTQTQTPLHFDSVSVDIRRNHSNEETSKPPPLLSENNSHLLQDSKILHSLLGGIRQLKAVSPNHIDNNNNNKNSTVTVTNIDAENTNLPTTVHPFVSNLTTEMSGFSSNNMDDDLVPPLQIVTKTRLPTVSMATPAKTKGPFPCQGCGKCFNARHQLKRHEMTHTEVRPYRCVECGKAFRQKVHLSDHLKRHRGQRPFLCTICGKRFVLKNELKQHTKNYCRKTPGIVSS